MHREPDLRSATMRWWTRSVHGRDGRRLSDGLARGCLRERSVRAADCLRSRSVHPATSRMHRYSRRMRGRAQLFLHQPSLGLSGPAMPVDRWTTSHLRGGRVNTSRVVSGLLTSRAWALISCSLAAWSCSAATSKKPSADSSANQASPMCAVPAFPPAPTCAGTCGNGVRDSCPYCAPQILIGGGNPGPGGNSGPACPTRPRSRPRPRAAMARISAPRAALHLDSPAAPWAVPRCAPSTRTAVIRACLIRAASPVVTRSF